MIEKRLTENQIDQSRICNFLQCSEVEISEMLESRSLDSNILLKWSKLLEYDFFRVYTQHLILYAPSSAKPEERANKSSLPQFRKNIYTKEIIDFILEQINTKQLTKLDVMERYGIPKTTLYKWISKYQRKNFEN